MKLFTFVLLFATALQAKVVQVIDFETGDLSTTFEEKQGKEGSVKNTTEHARVGNHSVKTVMTKRDKRMEINNKYKRGTVGGVNWYGWSVRFAEDFPTDGRFDIFSQFHDFHKKLPEWGKDGKAPTCFLHRKGKLQLDLKYQTGTETTEHKSYPLGDIVKGEWIDFVVHVKWTHEDDGFFKVWRDGKLVVNHQGSTYMDYPAKQGPYFKAGNYKGASNWPGTSPRVIYIDEFRMGNGEASYEDVNPAAYADTSESQQR